MLFASETSKGCVGGPRRLDEAACRVILRNRRRFPLLDGQDLDELPVEDHRARLDEPPEHPDEDISAET
jgi:hypothetical protein